MPDFDIPVLDHHRLGIALLRALLGDDDEGVAAILGSTDHLMLLLSVCAMFNGVGEREAGSREAWDAYLADRLAEMPAG